MQQQLATNQPVRAIQTDRHTDCQFTMVACVRISFCCKAKVLKRIHLKWMQFCASSVLFLFIFYCCGIFPFVSIPICATTVAAHRKRMEKNTTRADESVAIVWMKMQPKPSPSSWIYSIFTVWFEDGAKIEENTLTALNRFQMRKRASTEIFMCLEHCETHIAMEHISEKFQDSPSSTPFCQSKHHCKFVAIDLKKKNRKSFLFVWLPWTPTTFT